VPSGAPAVVLARERGLEVVGELEIGWRLLANEFCAVTGTNGKTTTTEMIGAVHREAGLPVAVAGNVGTPVSAFAGALEPDATMVCEASSFQLEDADRFAPEVGVFLNLSDDHLDRHLDVQQYLDAKLRLFANQSGDDVAVLNCAEPAPDGRAIGGSARQIWVGDRTECELRLEGGRLLWQGRPLIEAAELRLRGRHNLENAMAAAAATLARGLPEEAVRSALRGFRALANRLEDVSRLDGVLYVNDSKATNVSSAAAALRSFDDGVHVILGGSLKGGGFAGLAATVAERCRACYLIGEAADRIAEQLAGSGVELVSCGDLERALMEASRRARSGETVLLAPACASFDQYSDYEQRGEHFRVLVARLEQGGDHQ
jgi:UDP-N-acetylmuramoylalanine--D-glutamate ligase